MKSLRVLIFCGASSIFLCGALGLTLRLSVGRIYTPSASSEGSVLSAVELAPTERIVIDYIAAGCRDYQNWHLELLGGIDRRLTVIDAGGSYANGFGDALGDRPSAIGTAYLSGRDCKGLDDLLRAYRHPDPRFISTTTITIGVSYFRGEEKIGVEKFVDRGMIESWLWQRDRDGTVPIDSGITAEMLSLPDLVQRARKASEELEPATVAMMPPAGPVPVRP